MTDKDTFNWIYWTLWRVLKLPFINEKGSGTAETFIGLSQYARNEDVLLCRETPHLKWAIPIEKISLKHDPYCHDMIKEHLAHIQLDESGGVRLSN